jgi:hypothetical protein
MSSIGRCHTIQYFSAGVLNPGVFRGLLFNFAEILFKSLIENTDK